MWTVKLSEQADEEYQFWAKHNPVMLKKINRLIDDICQHPDTGIGKPEQLKHQLSGVWSRRISLEHRLLYTIEEDFIYILSCRYHY